MKFFQRQKQEKIQADFREGVAQARQGATGAAIAKLEAVLDQEPDHVRARFWLGYCLQKQDRLDEAAEQFAQAVALDPGYAEAHYALGLVYYQQGQNPPALREIELAYQLGFAGAVKFLEHVTASRSEWAQRFGTANKREWYAWLQSALGRLGEAACIWRVTTGAAQQSVAGGAAGFAAIRERAAVQYRFVPYTDIQVYGLTTPSLELFFYPRHLTQSQQGKRRIEYAYPALRVAYTIDRYLETEGVPLDARIVDRVPAAPAADGFRGAELPVVHYGNLKIQAEVSGQNTQVWQFYISNTTLAQQLTQELALYVQASGGMPTEGFHAASAAEPPPSEPSSQAPYTWRRDIGQTPYEILDVSPGATRREITTAYRRMVKLYHPDKVAGLAPEFTEIAESRMRVINDAYELLLMDIRG